jgi:hypothetical protein
MVLEERQDSSAHVCDDKWALRGRIYAYYMHFEVPASSLEAPERGIHVNDDMHNTDIAGGLTDANTLHSGSTLAPTPLSSFNFVYGANNATILLAGQATQGWPSQPQFVS